MYLQKLNEQSLQIDIIYDSFLTNAILIRGNVDVLDNIIDNITELAGYKHYVYYNNKYHLTHMHFSCD